MHRQRRGSHRPHQVYRTQSRLTCAGERPHSQGESGDERDYRGTIPLPAFQAVINSGQDGAYADVAVKLGLIKLLSKQFDLCEEASVASLRSA